MSADFQSIAKHTVAPENSRSPAPLRPCSSGQRRFWVLDRLNPGNPVLNVAVRWRLEGTVSTADLEYAFRRIVERHEVLRTTFAEVNGEPWQLVMPEAPLRVADVDLRNLPAPAAEREMLRLSQAQARAPFDLAGPPPLLHAMRVRLSESTSVLLVTLHHIVCDGWSVGLLAHELGEICLARQEGRAPALAELPVSYADYAVWQADQLADESCSADAEYWRRKLQGLSQFELMTDRPRPPVLSANGNIQSRLLDRELTDRLMTYTRGRGCTLFMTTLAALSVLLHRYSNESDIALGTQVATRDEIELEHLIGLFVNTLVLRNDLSGDPRFDELLLRVRDTVAEAFEHQAMPLEKVIEMLRPPRDRSRNALFSINFVLQRSFIESRRYGSFDLVDMPPVSVGAMHDLNFFMVERPEGWRISCDYNTDLFEEATVARLLAHFERVLREIARDPSQQISRIPLLDDDERRALTVDWNRTQAEFPRSRTVVDLFAAQAAATPDATAVICRDMRMSYRELDQASTRLARELQARGVAPAMRTGVFLQRSPELVVALLAVLKAGNTYVPLDTGNPPERLAYIAGNAGLAALIARDSFRAPLAQVSAPLLLIDADAGAIAAHDTAPLPRAADPDDPAYIIYTSGSTGQPKGVLVQHRALVNLLWAVRAQPGVDAQDTFVSVSTIAFDISGLEVFLTLSVGARLVIATEQEVVDGAALLGVLRRHKATVMFATPVTWQFLLAAGWNGDPRLKIMCGGEKTPRELAERLIAAGNEFWHVYGPTETTIYASALRVDSPMLAQHTSVPLGGPLPNLKFYVLDAHGEPVPVGAPGELYIGGVQVALGYVGAPELTRERFLPDPFATEDGARMYRSGDIVRWRDRALMEFIGRADSQVKLRGFRIELGEIESALLRHAAVGEACVTVGTDANGDPTLWAYVVPHSGAARAAPGRLVAGLRDEAARHLPAYMRPAAITVLETLPRNQNGKVDRRALPLPLPAAGAADAEASAPPQSDTERQLVRIWAGVLGREQIGRNANFFELGGHSLLAARMLAQVEADLGCRLSLSMLFNAPTIAQLAPLLEPSTARAYDFRQVLRLRANGTRPPLIALNNTGIYFLLSRRLGPDQPFTTLQLFDPTSDPATLPKTFTEIAAGYVELIRRVQPEGPYRLLGWCVAGALAFEVAQQLRAAGEEVAQLAIIDAYVPGYLRRLSWPRRVLAETSHRLQLIGLDLTGLLGGRLSFGAFLANRGLVKRLRALRKRAVDLPELEQRRRLTAEDYDQWLLTHLQAAVAGYEPQVYGGRLQLFRARLQPGGRLLDHAMGWGAYAQGGVEVVEVEGDHFSMFQEPGVSHLAACLDDGPLHAVAATVQTAAADTADSTRYTPC